MNNLQRAVEDISKEFDEKYLMPKGDLPSGFADDIKSFLSDSIKKVLEDFVRETKLKKMRSCAEDGCNCGISAEECRGTGEDWNAALSAVQSKQREYLGE